MTLILPTLDPRPAVNCSACPFSHGLHFHPDPENCHFYYECIPEYKRLAVMNSKYILVFKDIRM